MADDLRAEATSLLRPLADLAAPVAPGATPPWEELLRVREHVVEAATSGCPASLAHDEFDGWRTAFARRRLGTAVLERLRRHPTTPPGTAAAEVVGALADTGNDSLARWLDELGDGGRAAAVRDATTFAVAARTALARTGAWPPAGTRFVADPVAFRWLVPGRAVRLEAGASAVATHRGERGAARSILLLRSAVPGDDQLRVIVSWAALVATLEASRPPLRVAVVGVDDGARRTFSVTDDVLDDGLTAAAAAVTAVVDARYGTPETRPAPARCVRCRGREVCSDALARA